MSGALVTPAAASMTKALQTLYARAFQEPQKAVEFFFSRMFDAALCLVCCQDGKPVSMAMNYPVYLTYDGKLLHGRYLYAVATLPEYRGRGYASDILRESERINSAQGAVYSMLKPAQESLFDYYRQRGYEPTFSLFRVTLTPGELAAQTPLTPRDATPNEYITGRFDALINTNYAFLWQGREFAAVLEGMALWGERCYRFEEGGIAVAARKGDELFIKELLVTAGKERAAVAGLHRLLGGQRITLHEGAGASFFTQGETFAYGSSRLLCGDDASFTNHFQGYMNLIFD